MSSKNINNISKDEDYDIELNIKNINIYGKREEFTNLDVEIPHSGKLVTVKVPNNITTADKIKLKGLGVEKKDGTKGDAYLIFEKIDYHIDKSMVNKAELKSLKCPNCGANLDDSNGIDTFKCKYCQSSIYLEGQSDTFYKMKTKIKGMEHDEKMLDKQYRHDEEILEKKYSYKKYKIEQEKKDTKRTLIFIGICFIIIFLLIFIFSITGKYKSDKQERELQNIINKIMVDIENKEYNEAYIKAQTIKYTENWSSEIEEKWDNIRKEVINQIIESEKKETGKSNHKPEHDGFFDKIFK